MRAIRQAGGAILLLALGCQAALAQTGRKPSSDWPCQQILVNQISLPAVWSGPPLDNVQWQDNPAIADLVAKLAARRTPIEEAQREIAEFAKAAGADKPAKLTMLFAGLFDRLNAERSQVIAGLDRFGHKQKDLADKIRAENTKLQAAGDDAQKTAAATESLQWDMRIFEDRRHALSYVCETPTLIEQRLFALAREIQSNID